MTNPSYAERVRASFALRANLAKAAQMEAYMKNHFIFFGIPAPERMKLTKALWSEVRPAGRSESEEAIRELWRMPERELQNFALFLGEKTWKEFGEAWVEMLEFMVTEKSWWDTVDFIAAHLAGAFFTRYPHLIDFYITKWLDSGNMWLQRTAILFQLKYKQRTNTELLYRCILRCADSKEFFLRKAIGWALREYAKTDPEAVRAFVEQHRSGLSPLSVREAMKGMEPKKKALAEKQAASMMHGSK